MTRRGCGVNLGRVRWAGVRLPCSSKVHERQMNGPNAYTLTEPWSLLYAFRKNRPIVLKGAVNGEVVEGVA
jgi:hypothetical protein